MLNLFRFIVHIIYGNMNAYYIIINRSSWELIVHLASSITFLSMVVVCDRHLYVHGRYTVTAFQPYEHFWYSIDDVMGGTS